MGLRRLLLNYWNIWFFYILFLFNNYWFLIFNLWLVIYWNRIVAVLTRINNFFVLNDWIVNWSINSFISIWILDFFNWLWFALWDWLFWGRWVFLYLFCLFWSHWSYFCCLSRRLYVNYFFDRRRLVNVCLLFFRRRNASYISRSFIIFIDLFFHF